MPAVSHLSCTKPHTKMVNKNTQKSATVIFNVLLFSFIYFSREECDGEWVGGWDACTLPSLSQ